jgi:hypothetical protein
MSNRRSRPKLGLIPAGGKKQVKVESKAIPVSDASKLLWKESMEPLIAAANAFNVAFANHRDRTVTQCAEQDGIDVAKFVFNIDTLEWVQRDNTAGLPTG